ncbi:MAG: threonine-phosphate decarboxylase CobD [Leptolyngbyaceae bacterium]|nr:threonine-phosphate decarboxylase CobD [Leptolyngbyaceae bacterium]
MIRPVHGGNLAWAATLAGCSPSAILDFSASINPLGPPLSAIAAIQANLQNLTAYPDPNYGELCSVLSQVHQIPRDWILPGNGSAELLTWAGRDLSILDATYLITPAFSDYRRALEAFHATVIQCPLDLELNSPILDPRFLILNPEPKIQNLSKTGNHGGIAPTHSQSKIQNLKSKIQNNLGLLLNNPHNPTGGVFTQESLLPYLKQFALVIVDEAFMDFLPGEPHSLVKLVQDYPNLVILRSLTKFYSLPGLRLGYAIAHPDRLRRWQQWRDPWPINTLAAAAAQAVLDDIEFQKQTWLWLAQARTQLYKGLTKLPGLKPHPSSANFLLVRSEQPSSKLQQQLLTRHQILIRDCLSFPELGDRYFRVAVRTEIDNQRLVDALTEVL